MPLVDYASSSEEEEIGEDEPQHSSEGNEVRWAGMTESHGSASTLTAPPRLPSQQKTSSLTPNVVMPSPALSVEKLPDASILFSSSYLPHQYVGIDRSPHTAASIAGTITRKRGQNESIFSHPQNKKHPRGSLPQLRTIPDTISGSFIPPQLKGRSNIVTEDISRLFLKRN